MTLHLRRFCALCACAFGSLALTNVAHAQAAGDQPANTQLPQQVVPTGAEDATAAPSAQARRSTAAASSEEAIKRELIRMTSESDEGLVAVRQSDGSLRVNLDDRFMSVVVATPTSDGGSELSCHNGHETVSKVERIEQIVAGKAAKLDKSAASAPRTAPQVLEEK